MNSPSIAYTKAVLRALAEGCTCHWCLEQKAKWDAAGIRDPLKHAQDEFKANLRGAARRGLDEGDARTKRGWL